MYTMNALSVLHCSGTHTHAHTHTRTHTCTHARMHARTRTHARTHTHTHTHTHTYRLSVRCAWIVARTVCFSVATGRVSCVLMRSPSAQSAESLLNERSFSLTDQLSQTSSYMHVYNGMVCNVSIKSSFIDHIKLHVFFCL